LPGPAARSRSVLAPGRRVHALDDLAGPQQYGRSHPSSPQTMLMHWYMPLLCYAQDAHQIDGDLDQIVDLVMAVAKIPGTPECPQSIFGAAPAGLHRPGIWCPRRGSSGLLQESEEDSRNCSGWVCRALAMPRDFDT
jgi:hypothetical protein